MSAGAFTSESGRPLDCISLSQWTVDCVVGVYGHERTQPQPLSVSLWLYLDTKASSEGGLLGTLDYARLAGEVRFLLQRCRFTLLEHAAEALARYVLAPPTADAPHAQVQAVTVTLAKPHALEGQALPSLTLTRWAKDARPLTEHKGFGQVDVLYESRRPDDSYGIYRLRIAPHGHIPTHLHQVMDEHELVLGGGLLLQGAPVRPGTAFHWPKGFAHRYDNPTAVEQTVLCVDRPAFFPEDEREVPAPAGGLLPLSGEGFYPLGDGGPS